MDAAHRNFPSPSLLAMSPNFALAPIVDGDPASVFDPQRSPVRVWIRAINDARQQTSRIQIVRGIRSAAPLDEQAVLQAYRARTKAAPDEDEIRPARIGAQESVKALLGALEHYQKVRTNRLLEPIYEAAEVVRAHVVVSGDAGAMKALVTLEEAMFETDPTPDEWGDAVKALVIPVGAQLPQDEEAQRGQKTESVRATAAVTNTSSANIQDAGGNSPGHLAHDVAEPEKDAVI